MYACSYDGQYDKHASLSADCLMQDFACEEPCDQTHSSERLDRFSSTACLKQVCTDILFCFWPSFVSSGPDFQVLQPTVQPSTLPYG